MQKRVDSQSESTLRFSNQSLTRHPSGRDCQLPFDLLFFKVTLKLSSGFHHIHGL